MLIGRVSPAAVQPWVTLLSLAKIRYIDEEEDDIGLVNLLEHRSCAGGPVSCKSDP